MWICILNRELFLIQQQILAKSRPHTGGKECIHTNALFVLVPDGLYTPDWVLTVAIPYILSGYTLLFPFEHPVQAGILDGHCF